MSIGSRELAEDELTEATVAETYSVLGQGDTPKLFGQSFTVLFGYDIPMGAGNSVDRKTVYIDRVLYQECMDGAFKATGLEPRQIIDRWIEHEHGEKCIVDGDNPVDDYLPAHRRALRLEHEGVLAILGRDRAAAKIKKYEETIWPALVRCYHREPKNPPKDLWCTPLSSHASEYDKQILERMKRYGVADADKKPKYSVHYNLGPHRCDECTMWSPDRLRQEHGLLAACSAVSGVVRADHHCDLWKPQKGRGRAITE